MKSEEYWRRRALRDKASSLADAQRLIREMRTLFADTQSHMTATIEEIFSSMGGDFAAARRTLSAAEIERLRRNYKQLVDIAASGRDNGLAGKLLSDLNKSSRINRLDSMLMQIDFYAAQLEGDGAGIVRKNLLNTAAGAYYHRMYDFEQYAGHTLDWSRLDSNKMEQLLRYNWSGKYWEDRWGEHIAGFSGKVKSAIGRGVLTGDSVQNITRELTKLTGIERYNAERIARTETAYIAERATAMSYAELDVTHYRYLAALDLRTSEKCKKLDGMVFALADAQMGVNYPPTHPNCRATTVPELEGANTDGDTRAARDPVTDKTEYVPADMTYGQWYERRVATTPALRATLREPLRGKGVSADGGGTAAFDKDAAKVLYPELKPKARNAIIEAHNDVLAYGALTGQEKGVVLDKKTGKRLAENTGGRRNVELSVSSNIKQMIVVHNHPNSTTVSLEDIFNINQNPVIDTVAVQGHNGTSYSIRIGNGQRILGKPKDIVLELKDRYRKIQNSLGTDNLTQLEVRHYIIDELAKYYGWEYRRYVP